MKNILFVGNTENIQAMISQLLLDNRDMLFHEKTMFAALRTLYGRKVDAVIVSSKEIKKQKLDFIGFIRKKFTALKIFVSFDNGLNGLGTLPEGVEFITPERIEDVQSA